MRPDYVVDSDYVRMYNTDVALKRAQGVAARIDKIINTSPRCPVSYRTYQRTATGAGHLGAVFFIYMQGREMKPSDLLIIGKRYNASTVLVLVSMLDFADQAGGPDFSKTFDDIQAATGLSRQTVNNSLHILDALGLVMKHPHAKRGNSYSLKNELLDYTSSSYIDSIKLIKEEDVKSKNHTTELPPPEPTEEYNPDTPFNQVSDAFIAAASIGMFNPPRWIESCEELVTMGATKEDVANTVNELHDKKFNISGPWSIVNACRMTIGKRKRNGNGHKLPAGKTYDPEASRKAREAFEAMKAATRAELAEIDRQEALNATGSA
jgi:hypothetical protein